MAAYRKIRASYPLTVAGQMELAQWCAKKKLSDQQRAHLTKVLELDPDHAEARAELGFRKIEGCLAEPRGSAAGHAARQANGHGPEEMERSGGPHCRRLYAQRSQNLRERAAQSLRQIKDPAAVVALETKLSQVNQEAAQATVDAAGGMSGSDAALALARPAVSSPWQEVRESAVEQLRDRPLEALSRHCSARCSPSRMKCRWS